MTIEPLSPRHDAASFTCGEPVMDGWLRQFSGQSERRGLVRTFVAVDQPGDSAIVGFYELCAQSVEGEALPMKRLPSYPVPAILLARLGVAREHQGKGIAHHLVFDAFRRCVQVTQQVGAVALLVDALNPVVAERLYLPMGFLPTRQNPLRLYLPMDTIRAAVAAAGA